MNCTENKSIHAFPKIIVISLIAIIFIAFIFVACSGSPGAGSQHDVLDGAPPGGADGQDNGSDAPPGGGDGWDNKSDEPIGTSPGTLTNTSYDASSDVSSNADGQDNGLNASPGSGDSQDNGSEMQDVARPGEIEIFFIYEESCASCDGTAEFYDIFNRETKDVINRYPYKLYTYNVFNVAGMREYKRIIEERELNTGGLGYPLLIIGGRVFSGLESIEKNLSEMFLTAGEDVFYNGFINTPVQNAGKPLFWRYKANPGHATILYFYRIECDECVDVKPFIDDLPASIIINGVDTPLDIIRINTRSGNNADLVRALFERYNVDDGKQVVPIVFLAETYLSGYDEIVNSLLDMLEQGAGLDFRFSDD